MCDFPGAFPDIDSDDDGFDLRQEIARSAFADMCHDTERNQKYDQALKLTIEQMRAEGREVHVLDIGTGSGLLSMMAVRAGADSVTACEAFRPMADCAERVIEANGMAGKIRLVKKRSTEMVVGEGGDMVRKANLLVTELFDTELIGEGAIDTYLHALEHLLEKGCRAIPHEARVYAQLVECPLADSWKVPRILSNADGEVLLKTPPEMVECRGSQDVFDVQLSQMPLGSFNALAEPVTVFTFKWSNRLGLCLDQRTKKDLKIIKAGVPQAIFMWWDLKMDKEGTVLSCAPFWKHPDFDQLKSANKNHSIPIQNLIPWRDHWMQAIYYLPHTKTILQVGQTAHLYSFHDEYSLWFMLDTKDVSHPYCTCDLHLAYPRSRIGQLNDSLKNKETLTYLEQQLDNNSVVLVLGQGSLLGLALSTMKAKIIFPLETEPISNRCMQSYVDHNNLKNVAILSSIEQLPPRTLAKITHIFAEPYFTSSLLPWENAIKFGAELQTILPLLRPDVVVIPKSFSIHAVPVQFLDLHKIAAPLGTCEGFDLSAMDRMIEEHSILTDSPVEPQPLWEYPCFALGPSFELITLTTSEGLQQSHFAQGTIAFNNPTNPSKCNGIAIWADFHMDGEASRETTISTGPLFPIKPKSDEPIRWNANWRQGVHLLKRPLGEGEQLAWSVKYSAHKWKPVPRLLGVPVRREPTSVFNEQLRECCFKFEPVAGRCEK